MLNRRTNAFSLPAILLLPLICALSAAEQPVEIEIGVKPGLRYDTPRFQVPPGADVRLTLRNNDQMMHNLVITRPEAREKVVNAAIALGDRGPELQFVPDLEEILWKTKVLSPGESQTLAFQAPETEGVYPYVCTYPGHGFFMFGAMYVQPSAELPPLGEDPHVPPPLPEMAGGSHFLNPLHEAKVVREFMPDAGPASIAIGMPGGQSVCWDAGVCRLRYIWSGGFITIPYHKNDRAKLLGEIYFRTQTEDGLQIGQGTEREVEFLGYRLRESYPEFRYRLNGVEVRELIRPAVSGPGITRRFVLAETNHPVRFVTTPNERVKIEASTGSWNEAVLELSGPEASEFTVTILEPVSP